MPPSDARQDGPRVGELEEEAEEPDHEQDVGEVRVGDRQQEPLAEGHRQIDHGLAGKGQDRLGAVEPLDRPAVEAGDELLLGAARRGR